MRLSRWWWMNTAAEHLRNLMLHTLCVKGPFMNYITQLEGEGVSGGVKKLRILHSLIKEQPPSYLLTSKTFYIIKAIMKMIFASSKISCHALSWKYCPFSEPKKNVQLLALRMVVPYSNLMKQQKIVHLEMQVQMF